MDPPKEWMEKRAESGEDTQVKWKLLKEWYGRRIVGTSWVEWFGGKLKQRGFLRSSSRRSWSSMDSLWQSTYG